LNPVVLKNLNPRLESTLAQVGRTAKFAAILVNDRARELPSKILEVKVNVANGAVTDKLEFADIVSPIKSRSA
jgi:hypothetical protein